MKNKNKNMKILRYNESNNVTGDINEFHISYNDFEESNIWSLLFYNDDKIVHDVITFGNKRNAVNYILNYVNSTVLNLNENKFGEDYKDYNYFTDYKDAIIWINDFHSGEQSIDLINSKKASNIEFLENIKLLINTGKYNL